MSVALNGVAAVVCAPYHENAKRSVSVFIRSGTAWTQEQKLVADDGSERDVFGMSVVVSASTAVIVSP